MTGDITSWVWERLIDDETLSETSKEFLLQALLGEEIGAPSDDREAHLTSSAAPGPEAAGAFIKAIVVQGFRGIGNSARLDLIPAPGLTVVSGRNGSGKSSFAEALEVALSGTTYRWHNKRSKQWQEAWRNVHSTAAPGIEVVLAEETVGKTRIFVQWADDDVTSVKRSMQRAGEKKKDGIAELGWDDALTNYRPLLSYEELDGILHTEPSKLYDAISRVLGLEQIAAAIKRLADYSAGLHQIGNRVKQSRGTLLFDLGSVEDERARAAERLLRARTLDVKALADLATGAVEPDSTVAHSRQLANLSSPDGAQLANAAQALREAVVAMAEVGDLATQTLQRLTDLRALAVAVHDHEGDLTCPVCHQGYLDENWAETTRQEIAESRQRLTGFVAAQQIMNQSRNTCRGALADVPAVLRKPPPDDIAAEVEQARRAWERFADAPSEDLALADHLDATWQDLVTAVDALTAAASEVAAAREDLWSPVATRLAQYANEAAEWEQVKPHDDAAKAAAKWLRVNDLRLKNERLTPIADAARQIWSELRQESNVDLASLTLEGTHTRRHVSITASVDGHEAGALSVMSQGELHALALTLFLPRATLPDSPFRFVVLDDPVQAMDPAKVDGLVTVLARIAKERQVIVFTHDDRLASAVRRSPVNAQILEVQREAGSKVTVANTFDPPMRYLRDAHALIKDDGLPEQTLRRVLPGMLRMALESACRERYFTRHLELGKRHVDLENEWSDARTTSARLQLAIEQSRDVWLRPEYRRKALGVCTSGFHNALQGDPETALNWVTRTVDDIKQGQ